MSKKTSKQASAPPVSLSIEDLMRMFRPDPIDAAIEKITEWPAKCPGPCFPLVFRSWMSHPAFQVA